MNYPKDLFDLDLAVRREQARRRKKPPSTPALVRTTINGVPMVIKLNNCQKCACNELFTFSLCKCPCHED